MEIIAVILFFAVAVWYLYRRFKSIVDPDQPSCSCSGCSGCCPEPETLSKQGPSNEPNR
jgi:hypothetical protein